MLSWPIVDDIAGIQYVKTLSFLVVLQNLHYSDSPLGYRYEMLLEYLVSHIIIRFYEAFSGQQKLS